MSEISFSSRNPKFSGIDLLVDFFHVCFFISSHPLYFSYFLFFSPYLLKLLYFLFPLFITTALLVLAYLTVSPNSTSDLPKLKLGTCCHDYAYQTVVARLQYSEENHSDGDDREEFRSVEELEVYKIMFDTSNLEVGESPVEESCSEQAFDAPIDESYSLGGNGSIGYFLEAASAILKEIRDISAEEMSSELVCDAPVDKRLSLEGNGTTGDLLEAGSATLDEAREEPVGKYSLSLISHASFGESSNLEVKGTISGNIWEAASAIWDENKGIPDEKNCSTDAAFDEKSSHEVIGSCGYFLAPSSASLEESPVEKHSSSQVSDEPLDQNSSLEGKGTTGNVVLEAPNVILEEKAVGKEKDVKPLIAYFNKVVEQEKEKVSMRRESKVKEKRANDGGGGFRAKSMVVNSQFLGSSIESPGVTAMEDSHQVLGPSLGSFGSMRKEKEWRRTLACKLFEERHQNVDGGSEGMDMLWETYDAKESGKALQGIKSKSKKQGKKSNKVDHTNDEDDEDEEDDEGLDNVQLCCLQALKFSAGKMNLGHMGRPNLVKITKALKGFGWLHHVNNKQSKKGYH